jgi:hypothetical protein
LSKEYIKAQTPLPAYFPYPKFLLQMSLSHTARLTYVLLLDRMTLSQKNSWVDAQGRAYVLYPLAGLAEDLQSSISSVTRALLELCTPIACTGPSMRKDIGQAKLNLLKALLA